MKKTYKLLTNNDIETLNADELLARMNAEEAKGFHIEECIGINWADFMVCYW